MNSKIDKLSGASVETSSQTIRAKLPGINNQDGFVLVVTMVVLVLLTLIGISATNLTTIELYISGNDRVHKDTFYKADGGSEIGTRLVYDNAICVQVNDGFDDSLTDDGCVFSGNRFKVYDPKFASPKSGTFDEISDAAGERDLAYYPDGVIDDTAPHTNVRARGAVKYSPGSGLQMVSGYEGLGASSIGGGSHLGYDVWAQHHGIQNSESIVKVGWKMSTHLLNSAATDDCQKIFKEPEVGLN